MPDTPDAATARALLEAKREGYALCERHHGESAATAARHAERIYPDPAPPAPKRLGRMTDEELEEDAGVLRCRGFLRAANFLDAARALAGEITPEMIMHLQQEASELGERGYTIAPADMRFAAARLARLAGLPATEEG